MVTGIFVFDGDVGSEAITGSWSVSSGMRSGQSSVISFDGSFMLGLCTGITI